MKTNIYSYHISLILQRIKNSSDKNCIENEAHILCSIKFFFFSENRAVYEIMWKNITELKRPQLTIWRIRIAFWIPKATNTHSQYVTLIASQQQQWLHERASVLRCTSTVRPVERQVSKLLYVSINKRLNSSLC